MIKVTKLLYEEIERCNLPGSGNGFSAQTYSKDPVEQEAFERFDNKYKQAKKIGGYYMISVNGSLEIGVAIHCLENVAHLNGHASIDPKPSLVRHCEAVLTILKKQGQ